MTYIINAECIDVTKENTLAFLKKGKCAFLCIITILYTILYYTHVMNRVFSCQLLVWLFARNVFYHVCNGATTDVIEPPIFTREIVLKVEF